MSDDDPGPVCWDVYGRSHDAHLVKKDASGDTWCVRCGKINLEETA